MSIFTAFKGVINNLFEKKSIRDIAFNLNTSVAMSNEMDNAVRLWAACYRGEPPWINETESQLELPYAAAHEMARLVTLEYTSSLGGSKRADFLNDYYSDAVLMAAEYTEYACAGGGVILKPYVCGKDIITDYIQSDAFFPTRFSSSGKITGCIFSQQITIGNKYYTRLEYHDLNGTVYTVRNKAFVSDNPSVIGRNVSLEAVPEWADLSDETIIRDLKYPLFSYFKMPGGNSVDRCSPLGVSVYDKALGVMEDADRQYSRLLWEMEGSELAVFADTTVLRQDKNTRSGLPDHSRRLFKAFELDQHENSPLIVPYSPAIREQNQINALNEILKKTEYLCGLAYGTFSDMKTVEKTATEIKLSKQRSYATVHSIQRSHERAMRDYVNALSELCDIYSLAPRGDVDISSEYDDSLITDTESDQKIWLQEVSAGLMSDVEYRMRRYGESEEEARKMLPNAFSEEETD